MESRSDYTCYHIEVMQKEKSSEERLRKRRERDQLCRQSDAPGERDARYGIYTHLVR